MLPIKQMLIQFNISKRVEPVKYIVVHDTGNRSAGANAEMHYKYFNGGNRKASADFFVDDSNIIQTVDFTVNSSWHCGTPKAGVKANNKNAIGIEICINSDGNYAKAVCNAIDLVAYLCVKLNIPVTNVIRHYDVSGKNCPQTMNNKGDWSAWTAFIKDVEAEMLRHTQIIKPSEPVKQVEKEITSMADFKTEAVDYLIRKGILTDASWKEKVDEPAPCWLVFVIAKKILEKLL